MSARALSMKAKLKMSPVTHRERVLTLCTSNMKANRQTYIEQLRKFDKKQVAVGIMNDINYSTSNEDIKSSSEGIDDLQYYLQNDDYEFILEEIMAELSNEYYGGEEIIDNYDEYESNPDKESVLCPVCRVEPASIDPLTCCLRCSCGLNIPLRDTSLELFKELLTSTFERHRVWSCGQCQALSNNMFPLQFEQHEFSLQARCDTCHFSEMAFDANQSY